MHYQKPVEMYCSPSSFEINYKAKSRPSALKMTISILIGLYFVVESLSRCTCKIGPFNLEFICLRGTFYFEGFR